MSTPTPTPGWKIFEAPSIEIWLPNSYAGGDIANNHEIITKLKKVSVYFEYIATKLETNLSSYNSFVLWAVDTDVGDSGYLTTMKIRQEQDSSPITLDTYIDSYVNMIKESSSQIRIVDQRKVKLDLYEVTQLIIEIDVNMPTIKEFVNVIMDNNTVWIITYSTDVDEFEKRLPIFEQSVRTFYIQP
jgi:serine/threonine-protein kinase